MTWVVRGVLHHEDSTGRLGDIQPGDRATAERGSGRHAQRGSPPPDRPRPKVKQPRPGSSRCGSLLTNQAGRQPMLTGPRLRRPRSRSGRRGEWTGADRPLAPVTIARRGAALLAGRVAPGQSRRLPGAQLMHLYVVTGGRARHRSTADSRRQRPAKVGTRHGCLRREAGGDPGLGDRPASEVIRRHTMGNERWATLHNFRSRPCGAKS